MKGEFYEHIAQATKSNGPYWGYHFICDVRGCDESTVNSADTLKSFLDRLVQDLHMIPVGKPLCYEFNDENGRGVSAIQLITTSHFSVHTDDDKMSAYIDVFSCQKYDPKVAIDVIKEFFNPREMKCKFILRNPNGLVEELI